MEAILKFFSNSAAVFLLILIIAVVVQSAILFKLSSQLRQVKNRWRDLLAGVDGENLERMVYDVMKQSVSLEEEIVHLKDRTSQLEGKMKSSKRYAGLTRFDAFEDVGGSQSFSMAVYDEEGNGIVITSQVGRDSCRVFGKPLHNGKSEVNLTVEEERAIEAAVASRPRPRIGT